MSMSAFIPSSQLSGGSKDSRSLHRRGILPLPWFQCSVPDNPAGIHECLSGQIPFSTSSRRLHRRWCRLASVPFLPVLILFIHQIKTIVHQFAVYCVGKPSGNRLILFLKWQPYSRCCDNGVCCHISRVVIPWHTVPNEQAYIDFLELWNGVF